MPVRMNIQRRAFLVLAVSTVGGLLTVHAAKPVDPRYVSLGDAHKGTVEIDLRIMNQFGDQPQEVQDFYVACREAMTGENPEREVAAICRAVRRGKLGGPMLGDVTSTGVSVWIHLPEPGMVAVEVTPEAGGAPKVFRSDDTERTLSVRCGGLSPDTAYAYKVTDSESRPLGKGRFVTAPADLSEEPFRIAFGTCFHKVGIYRPELMNLIQARGNRAMLVIGDSAVDGRKCDFGLINADYLLRNLSQPWHDLTANVPVYATWDDHDYWGDDTSGTIARGNRKIDVDGLRQALSANH